MVGLRDQRFERDRCDRLETDLRRPQKMKINNEGSEDTLQVIRDGMKSNI